MTLKEKIIAESLKDIPASFWKNRSLPNDDEDLDDFVEKVQEDYGSFMEEYNGNGSKNKPVTTPKSSGQASKEEIAAIMSKM